MKKILLAFIATSISIFGVVQNINAQTTMRNAQASDARPLTESAATTDEPAKVFNGGSNSENISAKAIKNFQKTFQGVTDAKWYRTKSGDNLVKFNAGSVPYMVAYNPKGRWNYTILNYDEKKLPADVRKIVKSSYYDYSIEHVSEVHVQDQIVFMVTIQDETTLKIVRVSNGEMDKVTNYTRG